MASKKLEKGSADWQFFQDFWKFRQEYYEPEEKDEWFDELIKVAELLRKKYENTEVKVLAKDLIVAHLEDVDRRSRNEQGD